jgi:hypothetical protein
VREPDERPGPLAQSLLAAAVVADLRSDADELAALARETLRPLPVLPLDPVEREIMLTVLLLQARDQAKRVLALVANGDVRS